jgi:hypothetical protein
MTGGHGVYVEEAFLGKVFMGSFTWKVFAGERYFKTHGVFLKVFKGDFTWKVF